MVGGAAVWEALRWVLTCWCELGPAMPSCRAMVVLELVFPCWWVGLGPRGLVPAHWCMMLFLRLVLAYWWAEPCPVVSCQYILGGGLGPAPSALWWAALCPRQAVGSGSLKVVSCW